MIARPHICLRCQSRLAKRSAPSKSQFAFQSTDARAQRSRIIPHDHNQDEGGFHPTRRPLRLSRRPLGTQKQLSEHPLGKLYGYTGQQLRENREKLSVNVLGEAAEVIVLRDSKISNYNHQIEENVETQEGIDILAKLDEERGLVGWDEVEANINEFRPKEDKQPQTTLEFSKLVTKLQGGFTVAQLAKYLQAHGQTDTKAPKLSSTSLIQRISPWIPGISESDSYLDQDELQGYDLRSYTSKQRLVLRILRECWKLKLPFVEEGIGQVEVELAPGDFDLLLRGASSPLSSIHSKYIVEKKERLESFKSKDTKRSRNAIRITTTRIKSCAIVWDIERTLKGIHRIQIPLKALMPTPKKGEKSDFRKWIDAQFDDSVIEEVARLTNTDIQKTSSDTLSISSIEPDPDYLLSNRPDLARRLVLASVASSDRETSWVGCKEIINVADGVLVKYPKTEGLSWRDRLRQWTRWTTPISKEAESKDNAVQKVEESKKAKKPLLPVPIDSKSHDEPRDAKQSILSDIAASESLKWWYKGEPRFTGPPKPDGPDVAYWDGPNDIGVETSAIMGSVLHNIPPSSSSAEPSQCNPLFVNAVRSFSTSVPNISRILAAAVASNRRPTESVVTRFLPNPFALSPTGKSPIGSEVLSAFPPVEIRFGVRRETKDLFINYIRAVLSTENSDLMLPDSPIDIRFQQRTTSRLHCTTYNWPEALRDFLEKSNLTLDFEKGGGLNTPPSLMIPIASHMCKSPGFELLGIGKNDAETHDVEYLFAGLEIRKTIAMEFEGWRLLYTSVEAGKAGGRRGELRLRPARMSKGDDPSKETEAAYLESAFRLADGSYTATEVRRIIQDYIRTVPTAKGRNVDRDFKYFAKRPRITYEWEWDSGDEKGGELLDNDIEREADRKEGLDDRSE